MCKKLYALLCPALLLVACGSADDVPRVVPTAQAAQSAQAAAQEETVRQALVQVRAGALLVDVRSPEEFQDGHLPGATNIPHTEIVAGLAALGVPETSPVVLYCRSGNRSGMAMAGLQEAGYERVMNAGGYATLRPLWAPGEG